MITSVYFDNFKAFQDFTISLRDFNILTGLNNHGKSTVLDALRVLRGAYGYASRLNPSYQEMPNGTSAYGYKIPQSSIPIILENIQTNYEHVFSRIRYRCKDGQNLYLLFSLENSTYLYFDTPRRNPLTSSAFKKEFPLNIYVIPTLGPLEIDEELLSEDYVKQWSGSRRAPRMFRSYWFYNPEDFDQFRSLVEKTWEGMSIIFPEKRETFSKDLVMFCSENRIFREVCWAGFGFQIWIQLLTHVIKSQNADIVVVDEPEIYLHPDLQHKILDILKSISARVVLATHSVEIINNADPTDVLVIDKTLKSAKRISDLEGLQQVANLLGSGQNIQLTRLARGKKILFVEGKDAKFLSKFSKLTGHLDLFTTGEITIIPIEGFSQYERILSANWAFSTILGEDLKIAALFDRDYRTQQEIENLTEKLKKEISFVHVFCRKEIENYALIPEPIKSAILDRLEDRSDSINRYEIENITSFLFTISDELKSQVFAQLSAHQIRLEERGKKDIATVISTFTNEFELNWKNLEFRLKTVPGKIFFTTLNDYLQKKYKISITLTQIINNIKKEDLDLDLYKFFDELDRFRKL